MMRAGKGKRHIGFCDVLVNRGDSRWSNYQPCGRPSAGRGRSGEDTCSFHLKVEQKQRDKTTLFSANSKSDDATQAEGKRLAARLGIKADVFFDWHVKPGAQQYARKLVVSFEDLERILEERSAG